MDEKKLQKILWRGVGIIVAIPLILLIYVSSFQNQGISGIKEWLLPISGCVSLITVAISSWLAVNHYLLKIEAEKRLNDSASTESNIRLLTHFSKMMQMANSRYDPILSEKVIEGLFQNKIINADDYKDEASMKLASQKLEQSLLTPTYGAATQKAAIGAIYALGKEHYILRDAAIEGLTSINANLNYESIEKFIDDLKKLNK
jgi:uncharacterized protein YfeS